MPSTRIDTAANAEAGVDGADGLRQGATGAEHAGQPDGMIPDNLCCIRQAAIRMLPGLTCEPMLNHAANELGIDFTQDAPGVGTAPLIDPPLILPPAEQLLDLPPRPKQQDRKSTRLN